jgi:hypothetical protein
MKNGTVSVFGEAIERTAKERAHLIKLLQDSQKEYLSYVENVSEAQWNWRPVRKRKLSYRLIHWRAPPCRVAVEMLASAK